MNTGNIDFENFSETDWFRLLCRKPEFIELYLSTHNGKIDTKAPAIGYFASALIEKQPSLSKYLNFEDFSFSLWCDFLERLPSYKDKAKEYLDGWIALLALKIESHKDCPFFKDFNQRQWLSLVSFKNKDLIEEAKKYPNGWAGLILKYPHFAYECNMLSDISPQSWVEILNSHPELEEKCNIESFNQTELESVIYGIELSIENLQEQLDRLKKLQALKQKRSQKITSLLGQELSE